MAGVCRASHAREEKAHLEEATALAGHLLFQARHVFDGQRGAVNDGLAGRDASEDAILHLIDGFDGVRLRQNDVYDGALPHHVRR